LRLSEKTIEINTCAQITQNICGKVLWFGLTQKQEAIAGFDAATSLNGRIFIFQFKASNKTMKNTGARRFLLEHDQLNKLSRQVKGMKRSVFYAFPLIGNTSELQAANGDFLGNTWLLDVSKLPNPFPAPITNTLPKRLRKNSTHYADVIPSSITIHSDPVELKIEKLSTMIDSFTFNNGGLKKDLLSNKEDYTKALEFTSAFDRNSQMAVFY
jgi:hypothetical protein